MNGILRVQLESRFAGDYSENYSIKEKRKSFRQTFGNSWKLFKWKLLSAVFALSGDIAFDSGEDRQADRHTGVGNFNLKSACRNQHNISENSKHG